jgi:hypothetical protein
MNIGILSSMTYQNVVCVANANTNGMLLAWIDGQYSAHTYLFVDLEVKLIGLGCNTTNI